MAAGPKGNAPGLSEQGWLVVGAASGIGRSVVERMHRKVGTMIAADLPGVVACTEEGPVPLAIDVADPESVASALHAAFEAGGGRLDVVVHTAGIIGTVQPSREETAADFERLVRVNLIGAFLVSQAALPLMERNGYGRLVHFASTAGKEGLAGMTGYSASKAGVMGLTKALAKEYARAGITINAVAPGKVDTPLIGSRAPSDEDLRRIPMGRLGTAEEAAALVEYIASPEASYTTGFVYDLSGGRATY
jgi:3-oxoacyl-[acyl-carrier protein] reductase